MNTLDLEFRQVCVNYEEDANFRWHHRVLLVSLGDSRWVALTPDHEVAVLDLADHLVVLLGRNVPFPQRVRGQCYTFDAIDPVDLEKLLEEARTLAALMGVRAAAPLAETRWRVSAVHSKLFGQDVPASATGNEEVFVHRGGYGLVHIDGEWLPCARNAADEPDDDFKRRLRVGPGGDPRLLSREVEDAGRRHLEFGLLFSLLAETKKAHWPIQGPRSVKEFVGALRQGGFESFVAYHTRWSSTCGANEKGGAVREHKFLCEVLRLGALWDQLDISGLASFELLVRRLHQIELAMRKNPKMPDYEGLDMLVDSAVDVSGAAVIPSVQTWLATHQKDEAFILKQRRLWAEEVATAAKKSGRPDQASTPK